MDVKGYALLHIIVLLFIKLQLNQMKTVEIIRKRNLGPKLQCLLKVKEDLSSVLIFRMLKITFLLLKLNSSIVSVDHNDIFEHK